MTELWIKLSDTGWGYRPGHETAHFMLAYKGPEVYGWVAACGQVLASPEDTPFTANEEIARCGRCTRSVNIHPDWQPVLMHGSWAPAKASTKQHQWIMEEGSRYLKSRCGVVRGSMEIGHTDEANLIAAGVSSAFDLPDCQKCLDYLGIDERKRPETVHTAQDGKKVSVRVMVGKGVYNAGKEQLAIRNTGSESMEFQEILLPVDEAGVIMDGLIQVALTNHIKYFYGGIVGYSRSFLCIPSEAQNDRTE